ncbi:MAG: phosphatidylserine decarboxylase family protein [Deltaproteobacteria bacterium]|nr:MAG: phosphatidylserine decarboxylase family protein [Deltaproteobacteria bacterium]RLB94993.1 MAG: phosphatidylserine decarboxylase family protein [Deltaproteobacteria bacterium]
MIGSVHRSQVSQGPFPLAREGYALIATSAFATAVFAIMGLSVPAVFSLMVTFFLGFFFRDPERIIPNENGVVVSPADGRVVDVDIVQGGHFAPEKMLKISIFMSLLNVHVNRIPFEGKVTEIFYHPGKFFPANRDKASADNERNVICMEMDGGRKLVVVQIAGLIARRIVCRVCKGDYLMRGERFGIICFGSRLDVYLPPDTRPAVVVGDKVRAGTSAIGYVT